MSRERIMFYRNLDRHGRVQWRWWWKARNGKIIGASTEGYKRRRDAIANLEHLAGASVRVTWEDRSSGYGQGELVRVTSGESVFVEVHR